MENLADETRWLDATEQARLVRAGEVDALELVEAAIERIEAGNGVLNAVVMKWYHHARELAVGVVADGPSADRPFAGIPFLLKDLHADYAGMPMTQGSKALVGDPPVSPHDTELVARYRRAGLVTLGRTNSPELGSLPVTEPEAYGPTRNPWDTSRTPGGSSGGAAAAVAAGFVPFAHASDGGGSIRIPASCCGLVGLKTSQGRTTMAPHGAEHGFSVHHAVTRTVRDTATLLDATCGPAVGDTMIAPAPERPYAEEVGRDPGRLRIGLLDVHPRGGDVHPDCVAAARAAATMLERLGHCVEPAWPESLADEELPRRFGAQWAVTRSLGIDGLAKMAGRELGPDDVEAVNWAQAEFARSVTGVDYGRAQDAIVEFRRRTQQWWADGWDLLVSPTVAEPPPGIGEHLPTADDPMAGMRRAGEWVPFTPPFNMSGQPAISLPLHWSGDDLPIGVQLVAAYGREDLLIRVAAQLEAAHPWAHRTPPT